MNQINKIKNKLRDEFQVELFEASIQNLVDKTNKLRYNNFAYSIRELSRHFLNSLSPDEKVMACSWFKPETENKKPSRAQRIKYAIQGGLEDIIIEEWGFWIEDQVDQINTTKKAIDSLSKYTHINQDVFNIPESEIQRNTSLVLNAFEKIIDTIDEYRELIINLLDGRIEGQMVGSIISNFFENIDTLAPHHSIDSCEVIDYDVFEINENEIVVKVFGNISTTLEYGSRKERREGDGLDISVNFPFETVIRYEISVDFPSCRYDIEEYDVDTSEWYE